MTHKVFSRFPTRIKFAFTTVKNGEVTPENPGEVIILEGCNSVLNHTLITKDGAMTVFKGDKRDPKNGTYSEADFLRLKEDPEFKRMLANGDLALSQDDLSKDLNGVGMLSDAELKENKVRDPDGNIVTLASKSA